MHEPGEVRRETVLREFERQVTLHVSALEELEREFPEDAAAFERGLYLQQRVFRQHNLGAPVGPEHEHTHAFEAAGQIVEQIDRGDIRPVQVVEEDHERRHA